MGGLTGGWVGGAEDWYFVTASDGTQMKTNYNDIAIQAVTNVPQH